MKLTQKLKNIKLLLLDVDGVLTDGSIILGNNNIEIKSYDIQDGLGIKMAQAAGIKVGIITGRSSDTVAKRAEELRLDALYQGQMKKTKAYRQVLNRFQLSDSEIAYIGDDILDLPVMRIVGLSVAVANARPEVKLEADYVTQMSGGKGAVREVIDLILKSQGKWEQVLEEFTKDDE
jgi:3-deoxy-D-manno-octulosonate 8-phosphate phosphatase (KDO 8-P phosphatase)